MSAAHRRTRRVGVVGCGGTAAAYLDGLSRLPELTLTAVADRKLSSAQTVARDRKGVRALTVPRLLADPKVDLVLNLSAPGPHAEVSLAAVEAGKWVYSEAPLALDLAQARTLLTRAEIAGIRVGCAPDTVLGTGIQTARRAIDDGLIGMPVAATATAVLPGPADGGPLLSLGPGYLTALVTLLGPVVSVLGAGSRGRPSGAGTTGPRVGHTVGTGVDTHVTGVLVHANRALSTLVLSLDATASRAPNLEVHGLLGSLSVPDPGGYGGDVTVRRRTEQRWRTLTTSAGYADGFCGIGLLDLVRTPGGLEPRTGGRLAFHVLDVIESLATAIRLRRAVEVTSTCDRPRPVPLAALAADG